MVFVKDLGSTSGTHIGGLRIGEGSKFVELFDKDWVRFGESNIDFCLRKPPMSVIQTRLLNTITNLFSKTHKDIHTLYHTNIHTPSLLAAPTKQSQEREREDTNRLKRDKWLMVSSSQRFTRRRFRAAVCVCACVRVRVCVCVLSLSFSLSSSIYVYIYVHMVLPHSSLSLSSLYYMSVLHVFTTLSL